MCPSLNHGLVVEVRPVADRCPVLSAAVEADDTQVLARA
jgi:hypothetical protein